MSEGRGYRGNCSLSKVCSSPVSRWACKGLNKISTIWAQEIWWKLAGVAGVGGSNETQQVLTEKPLWWEFICGWGRGLLLYIYIKDCLYKIYKELLQINKESDNIVEAWKA